MTEPESFGAWVKQRRKERRLTQEVLAEAASCSWETLRKVEAGTLRPSEQLAAVLLAALDVPAVERAALVALARAGARGQAPAVPPVAPISNLPQPATSFVGREGEVATLAGRLREGETRLLTLLGPGGVGKTRLALQVAATVGGNFPDGTFFVDLSAINDPALVTAVIGAALGVADADEAALLESLQRKLRQQRLLLLLDNFERVLAAAAAVDALLKAAPGLKVLTTSRIPLHIYGEKQYPVPPLRLPARDQVVTLDGARQYEAVRLFVERARDVKADFALTAENAAAVVGICVQLDGLPLATELAAARIRLLSPQHMLERLDQRLRLLAGGARNLPLRQQTQRAAIDWSYDLLDAGEQQLFRRLAVFSGGRGLSAIEAICDGDGELPIDVLDGVESLLDKSLLQRREERDGEVRFWMLETIQEYAREKLDESGEGGHLARWHADYFLRLSQQAEPHLRGADQLQWLARLELENDNLRGALTWARSENVTLGLLLGTALWRFWRLHGHLGEGRNWLETLLALPEDAALAARAGALFALAGLAWSQGDFRRSEECALQSLALFERLGDNGGQATALTHLGNAQRDQGDYDHALVSYERALAFYRALDDRRGLSVSLNNLSILTYYRGDRARAAALAEESLALRRQLGDRSGMAVALLMLGNVAYAQGDYARATRFYDESLEHSRGLQDKRGVGEALAALANIADKNGDEPGALRLFNEALDLYQNIGDMVGLGYCLQACGAIAHRHGASERAALLLGAGLALRETGGAPPWPDERDDFKAVLSAVRAALGTEMFAAAQSAGASLTIAEACALARAVSA